MAAIQQIDMSAAATLIVAWRVGHNAHGAMLKAGGEVIDALRGHARDSLNTIAAGNGRPYNPDDEQEEETPFLTANQDELLDTALLEQLCLGASLPLIGPGDLKKRTLALYALLIGDDPDSRAIFVRKGNPVSLATKSVVAIFDDTLTRVTRPILAFDSAFDVLLLESSVWVLNQKNFESLFKESEAVLARTSEWVDQLNQVLPITSDSKQWLVDRLRENSMMRRKIQSILRGGYLPKLTPDALRAKMTVHGLAADDLMKDSSLVFNKDTEQDLVLLLNEDLWTGDFSDYKYAAARKSRRLKGRLRPAKVTRWISHKVQLFFAAPASVQQASRVVRSNWSGSSAGLSTGQY
jgi:Domain of unknown function (DUF4868)